MDRPHRKPGELHATDAAALERAYHALCQHAAALQQDIEGSLEEAGGIEVEWVGPTDVAHELGVASSLVVGLAVVRQTLRALPIKGVGAVAKGLWLAGGCYLAARLAGGVIARFGGLLGRNARRKRRLLARLREAQARAEVMVALQRWEPHAQPAEPERPTAELEGAAAAAVAGPPSPPASTEGSLEMVEMPGDTSGAESAGPSPERPPALPRPGAGAVLESLRRYAQLGQGKGAPP